MHNTLLYTSVMTTFLRTKALEGGFRGIYHMIPLTAVDCIASSVAVCYVLRLFCPFSVCHGVQIRIHLLYPSGLAVCRTPPSMVQILMHHIRDCLPEIKSKLNVMMQSVSQELTELGEPTDCVSAASLGATLVRIENKKIQFAYKWKSCLFK